MADEVRLAKADLKRTAAAGPVTTHGLGGVVGWGSPAATALLIAVLSSRGVVGSQRAAVAASTLGGATVAIVQPAPTPQQPAARPFDAQAETKKLADAVRDLTADNDELKSRLAVVEHSVDDVTGSGQRQAQTTTPAAAARPRAAGAGDAGGDRGRYRASLAAADGIRRRYRVPGLDPGATGA